MVPGEPIFGGLAKNAGRGYIAAMNRTALSLAAALALAASLAAAQPKTKREPVQSPATPEYKKGVSLFNAYIAKLKDGAWQGNADNLPFIMEHGAKRGRSILLVHGLSDSPCYMRDLAKIFFDRGYNVVGARLHGHGTKPEDLQTATLAQWKQDVRFGLDTARLLGDEVSLAGFSTGGAMVLDLVDQRQGLEPKARWNMGDVFLFSPAIDLPEPKRTLVAALCATGGVASRMHPWASGDASTVEDNKCGYNKMASNGVCQLYKQIQQNKTNIATINQGLRGHGVYIVESQADKTVSVTNVVDFKSSLPSGLDWNLTLYDEKEGIAHANVPRASTNPDFSAMKADILDFVERCDARNGLRDLSLITK